MQVMAEPVTAEALARDLHTVMAHIFRRSGPQYYALVEELDLSITQIKALHFLESREHDASVRELAELLGLSVPATSRTVEALLRRDYLERREDEHDRRVKRVRLSPAGRGVTAALNDARLAGLEEFAGSLSERERTRLSGALVSLLAREDIAACRSSEACRPRP